jgi:probable HAF family extracellular repeat protein
MSDLGTPPWAHQADFITASDINSSGAIVGTVVDAGTSSSTGRGFLFQNGSWTDLGLLNGASIGAAAINDSGTVVGRVDDGGHGFVYQDGQLADLDDLVISGIQGRITSALDINNEGQILVQTLWIGQFSEIRFFVLTPTSAPSPASFVLIGVGMLALTRRKR